MFRSRSNRSRQGGKKQKAKKTRGKGTKWTAFVKKIYGEMKKKNPSVKLGAAMKDASKRKSEM